MSAKLKEDLITSFNKFVEDNEELNKNNLIKVINDVYNRNKVVKEKRPLSAYQIFMKEHYASVQEEEKKKGTKKRKEEELKEKNIPFGDIKKKKPQKNLLQIILL